MHILHVDDDPLFLELTEIYLNRTGDMTVTCCSSAHDALRLLETEQFDAIISDYQMPEMDGIELLFELRSAGYTLPFIIFTGRSRQEVVIDALNKGADFYIQKGGDAGAQFAELENAIRQAVHTCRSGNHLRQSRRRIADIFHHLPDATYAIDCSGMVIAWNRAMELMTGIHAGEIIGSDGHPYAIPPYEEATTALIDAILHPEAEVPPAYRLLDQEQGMIIAETEGMLPDGTIQTLWTKATLLYDENGSIAGAIESVRDITASRNAEKELIAAGEYRRSLIEAHIDPLVTIGPDGEVQDLNAATETVTGIPRERLIGKPFASLFTDPLSAEAAYQKTVRSGAERELRLTLRSPDGSIRPILFYGTVYRSRDGEIRGVFAELHEPVPGSDPIPQSCRCRGGRCGCDAESLHADIILHDLGNSVTATRGYLDLLGLPSDDEIYGKLKQAIMKSDEIIRTLSRHAGHQRGAGERISLDTVIRQEITHFPGTDIRYAGSDAEVLADDLLSEVVWNLLFNSVTYGGSGVTITIGVAEEDDRVIVTITDSGPGIPEGVAVPPPISRKGDGLCIVRDLVSIYGGEVWAASPEREGASISFSLRRAEQPLSPGIGASARNMADGIRPS
nr:response regulator [Methanocalculus chunghsingensis]